DVLLRHRSSSPMNSLRNERRPALYSYIPGHGTPTVILFRCPNQFDKLKVRAVFGIKSEPSTPDDPAKGLVWQSILLNVNEKGLQDEFTSSADISRETFNSHPWSIGGGGAADLTEALEESAAQSLSELADSIGITSFTLEDDVYILQSEVAARQRISRGEVREMVVGDMLRDWHGSTFDPAIFPYDSTFQPIQEDSIRAIFRYLWSYRTNLSNSKMFGSKTKVQSGLRWYEYGRLTHNKLQTPLSVVFAFVATHNHFVLDRGGKVFNRSAPIIKLPAEATEDEHLGLLGLLNSSTSCFWMKQVMTPKGGGGIGRGIQDEKWEVRFEFAGTQMEPFPVPETKPLLLSRRLDEIARRLGELAANSILKRWARGEDLKRLLEEAESKVGRFRGLLIALQEELDWECYRHYGLLTDDLCYPGDDLPELKLGERAFEIVMARQMAQGQLKTAWFDRHGSTPITELPTHWQPAYRKLVERRIQVIATNKEIALIEKPEYKRRWNTEPWAEQQKRALENWLLDRLETPKYRKGTKDRPELTTTAQMADVASADAEFLQVAALYRGRPDFDVASLVAELVEAESVPLLLILRYKPAGLRKREVWERTWDLQRQQDAGEDVGDIPVPPKYGSTDFLKPDYWRLRGKLDVPKERWVSYPHCSTDSDPTLVVGWAGWNHLEQATALIAYYDTRKREGWDAKRLTPLLAGLDQLLPWIHQWHTEIDAEFGETAGQSFQAMLAHDAHELGLTLEAVRTWTPPEKTRKARTPGKKKAPAGDRDDA
ncbi:MAG: BREX-2 system adenine-specific DNA-methyltransferase PglX, partial [Gemmataceae bacterium]|nr:BREX-2 system adenine-specific DNA-methyltransferase PglX [Gemmataceae bacterium]